MYQIEYCYDNGDLARALELAAAFARKIGEEKIHHIVARLDDEVKGAWWVDVVYEAK